MSIGDDIRKEIDRIQQGSRPLGITAGLDTFPRASFHDLLEAAKPAGGLLADAMAKASISTIEANSSKLLRRSIANAARDLHERADPFRGLVQPIYDFQTQLARAAHAAFQPFAQAVQAVEQMRNTIHVAFEPLQRIREAFGSVSADQFSLFQRALVGLGDDFRLQWDPVEKPVFRLFTKLGLTGLESYLTRSELLYVLRVSQDKGNKAVQEYVFRRFRKAKYKVLNLMVRGWWSVPYMRKRKKSIRAAISAHKNRQFELAIPTLLPLIDGLAAEIVVGTPNHKKKTIYAKDAAKRYNADEAEVWSECVEQVVFSLMYKDYDFMKARRPPSSVNRHGILHGRIVDYGSELNSYRVILLLDVMVRIAEQKSKRLLHKTDSANHVAVEIRRGG